MDRALTNPSQTIHEITLNLTKEHETGVLWKTLSDPSPPLAHANWQFALPTTFGNNVAVFTHQLARDVRTCCLPLKIDWLDGVFKQ